MNLLTVKIFYCILFLSWWDAGELEMAVGIQVICWHEGKIDKYFSNEKSHIHKKKSQHLSLKQVPGCPVRGLGFCCQWSLDGLGIRGNTAEPLRKHTSPREGPSTAACCLPSGVDRLPNA